MLTTPCPGSELLPWRECRRISSPGPRDALPARKAAIGTVRGRKRDLLWAELTAGKWNIAKATLETYISELKTMAPDLVPPAGWEERMALAQAAEWAFDQPRTSGRAATASSMGRPSR